MAEDERLDLKRSRRWREVYTLFARGEPMDRIREKVIRCLYGAFRRLVREYGFPMRELLEAAAGSGGSVRDVVRRCEKGREYAQFFELEAGRGLSRQAILAHVCNAVCDRVFDQIEMEEVVSGRLRDFSEHADLLRDLKASLQEPIERLATKVAEDPSRPVRMLPVARQARIDEQKALLSASLIRL